MFFFRNDRQLLARARKRVKSSRAAVFAEFCFIAPLLVMLVSAMIEIAGFFDAQVMANHAAWTVGRQATVHMMDEIAKYKTEKGVESITGFNRHFTESSKNKWKDGVFEKLGMKIAAIKDLRDHGRITVAMLMATCGMGYFGMTPAQAAGDVLKSVLVEPIKKLFKKLTDALTKKQDKPKEDKSWSGFLGEVLDKIIQKVLVEGIINPIEETIVNSISAKIDELMNKLFGDEKTSKNVWERRFKQLYSAAARACSSAHKDSIYSFTFLAEGTTNLETIALYRIDEGHNPLDFPQAFCLGNNKPPHIEDYVVKGYCGWPPAGQHLPMIRVDVKWPYSLMWTFPVVSGLGERGKPVVAEGSSLVFSQPMHENAYLRSKGAKAFPQYKDGTKELTDALEEIMKKAKQLLRAMIWALKYRYREESLALELHPRKAGYDDNFYTPLIFFWWYEDVVKEHWHDAGNSEVPWGSWNSTDSNTIRDQSMGYAKTAHALTDTWQVSWRHGVYSDPVEGDRQRGGKNYFYWKNDGPRHRYTFLDKPDSYEYLSLETVLKNRSFTVKVDVPESIGYKPRKRQFNHMIDILKQYQKELDAVYNGNGTSSTNGPASLINLDDAKNLDLSDTKAVVEYVKGKWEKMEKGVNDAYVKVDEAVAAAQSTGKELNECYAAYLDSAKDFDESVNSQLPGIRRQAEKYRGERDRKAGKVQECSQRLAGELDACLEAESELCALLGSKSALDNKGKKIDEVPPIAPDRPVDYPDSKHYEAGDDTGEPITPDTWKWTKGEGWRSE